MTLSSQKSGAVAAPGLLRRLACMLYEGVLLFGVVMAAGMVYAAVTHQTHALKGLHGLQAFLFLVLGVYFVSFWTRTGQTLAMRTWRIQIVTHSGRPLTKVRATARYLLSWLWFLPALAIIDGLAVRGSGPAVAALCAGVLVYAGLSILHPSRQYWHDVICGTRLINSPSSTA